ncbi:hypothetical protein GGR53DRAFT_470120 [Hypoxylon sp. FL1150]|nr:hypothetical protein GGR53DRAFT_470120 [Hypoxylon sp. FL1150]
MSTTELQRYYHYGLLLPYEHAENKDDEWATSNQVRERGYLLVKVLSRNLFVVQSVGTGKLLAMKIMQPKLKPESWGYLNEIPEDLRISTAENAICRLPSPRQSEPKGPRRIHFAETVAWKRHEGDIYSIQTIHQMGMILNYLCMAHMPPDPLGIQNPYMICPIGDVNDSIPADEAQYSDDLIRFLENFYDPDWDLDNKSISKDNYEDADGDEVPIWTGVQSPEWVRDVMLPLVRAKVQEYKDTARRTPGYYDMLDVSWTKPSNLMPFNYFFSNEGNQWEINEDYDKKLGETWQETIGKRQIYQLLYHVPSAMVEVPVIRDDDPPDESP